MIRPNVNNALNRLDAIDLLFQTGPGLPDSLGTVPSDVGWKDQCLFRLGFITTDDGLSRCGLSFLIVNFFTPFTSLLADDPKYVVLDDVVTSPFLFPFLYVFFSLVYLKCSASTNEKSE